MMKLHHINVVSPKLAELVSFYEEVLGMQEMPGLDEGRKKDAFSGAATWLTDGNLEAHLCVPDYDIAFRTGHSINPTAHGHVAFRTDDIAAFKKRLTDRGVPFADYGGWAMKGWHQIFFHDPAGTVIEVHQVYDT